MTLRVALTLALIPGGIQSPAPQPRGTITGIVVDSASGERVADATVTTGIERATRTNRLSTTSNERGEFAFTGLATGWYTLEASKAGFVASTFGAKAPGRKGVTIVVADDAPVAVMVKLFTVARISGRVTIDGRPAVDATVTAVGVRTRGNSRSLAPQLGGVFTSTDEHGEYSLYGVGPGEYIVAATPHANPAQLSGPTLYPGATTLSTASTITVEAGEERTGADIAAVTRPPSRINVSVVSMAASGTAANVDIVPAFQPRGTDSAFRSAVQRDPQVAGRFVIDGLPPGRYVVSARSSTLSARAEIELDGGNVADLRLLLEQQATVSGRVVFRAHDRTPLPDFKDTLVVQRPVDSSSSTAALTALVPPLFFSAGNSAAFSRGGGNWLQGDGSFAIRGVSPGRYQLTLEMPLADRWYVESMPTIEVRSGQPVSDVLLVLSDRPTGLTGHVFGPAGAATSEYFIAVVPGDRSSWIAGSSAMAFTRARSNGEYLIRPLPAGDYYVLALDDVDEEAWFAGEWPDFDFASGVRVSITSGETKTLDLRTAR